MLRHSTLVFLFAGVLQATISLARDDLPAQDRLKSCNPKIALAAAKEIINDPKTLNEPLQLFSPALILFQQGERNDAVFWFYAAQLRVRYQLVFDKGDRGQVLSIMLMTVGQPINNYAFQDVTNLNRILDRVLEWDDKTPNPYREKAKSEGAEKQIDQVYAGLREMKAKLSAEKDDLESKARQAAPEIQRMYGQSAISPCREGQLDPAYANQIMKKEKALVTSFTRNNQVVKRESGGIKDVSLSSYTSNNDSILPVKYDMYVEGKTKTIYAIVAVSRSGMNAKFTLVCVTDLSLGMRDSSKDECGK